MSYSENNIYQFMEVMSLYNYSISLLPQVIRLWAVQHLVVVHKNTSNCRNLFRTLADVRMERFCENFECLKAGNYIHTKALS